MGGERSRGRLRHSVPTVQVAADRIPAADPQVHHAVAGQRSFRRADFSEGILLPGLPLHVGEGWRSAASTGFLGNFSQTELRHSTPSKKGPIRWTTAIRSARLALTPALKGRGSSFSLREKVRMRVFWEVGDRS